MRWVTGSDGCAQLQYLGRTDAQVKIRGFRVELGEVDAMLAGADSVAFATTVVRRLPSGVDGLVSYVVPARNRMSMSRRCWSARGKCCPGMRCPRRSWPSTAFR
ncbi:hypothetical protein [Nocardia crassostreae]|uniref:hypothetical protein n=1 Tax=Nocardia crassostreae TaxID=53428 RepID=UPI0012FAF13F|nr:hypothetical protein [Nocardia crassostreae]